MLSGDPSNEMPRYLRKILDAAPEEFLSQSFVSGYIDRMGYQRH